MARSSSGAEKITWVGRLVGVQPRIRLLRSFDERQHSYQGYVLRVDGTCAEETGEFLIAACIWGCWMSVEMIVDHWNPSLKKYRYETFCYGPKSCAIYRAGPTRKVPGRKGMSYTEGDWVDEDATSHRGLDD